MLLLDIVSGLVAGLEEIKGEPDACSKIIGLFRRSVPLAYIRSIYQHPKVGDVIGPLAASVSRWKGLMISSQKSMAMKAGIVSLSTRKNAKDFSSFIKNKNTNTNGFFPIIIAFYIAGFVEDDFTSGEEEEGSGDNKFWSRQRTLDLHLLDGGNVRNFRRKFHLSFAKNCEDAKVGGDGSDEEFTEDMHKQRYLVWWSVFVPDLISEINGSVGNAVLERVGQQGDGGGGQGSLGERGGGGDDEDDDHDDDAAAGGCSIGLLKGLSDLGITTDEQNRHDYIASLQLVPYRTLVSNSHGSVSKQGRTGLFNGIRKNDLAQLQVQTVMIRKEETDRTHRQIAEDYLGYISAGASMAPKGYLAKLDPGSPALNAEGKNGISRQVKTLAELIAFGTVSKGNYARYLSNLPTSLPDVDTDDGATAKRTRCQIHKYLLAISSMTGGEQEVSG